MSKPAKRTQSGTAPHLAYAPVSDYDGVGSFTFKANDGQVDSNIATVSIVINESGNQPPNCTQAHARPSSLWPPNHKMKSIQILGVKDKVFIL